MFRKVFAVLLLLIVFAGFIPSAHAQNFTVTDECRTATQNFTLGISNYMVENLLWSAGFLGVDMLTSFLQDLSVFGFQIGGIFEPIDQAIDFIRDVWMKAVIFGLISSVFNEVAGSLIEAGLALNIDYLTSNNSLLDYGGKLILQIANFGFIIGIIVIGIATILRREEFSANKILIKLVVGAIFVNLTIPIASGIVNLGTSLTEAFYNAASPCPGALTGQFTAWNLKNKIRASLLQASNASQSERGFKICGDNESPPYVDCVPKSDAVAGDFTSGIEEDHQSDVQKQLAQTNEQISVFTDLLGDLALDFASLLIGSILSIVAALTFLAFALFLLIRYVILMLLLTFSPLIWLGFIFPPLKVVWDSWWKNFLKWTFYGPVIILFLSFAAVFLNASSGASSGPALVLIAQYIAVIIISAMGIFLAFKFSGVAGKLVMAGVSGGVGFIAGSTQRMIKKAQVGAQMRAEQYKTQGKKGRAWFATNVSGRGLGFMGSGASLGEGAKSILSQVGISPKIEALKGEDVRKQLIEQRIGQRDITEGLGKGKNKFTQWVKTRNELRTLSLTEDDVKGLSKDDKKAVAEDVYDLMLKYDADPSKFTPEDVAALGKVEKAVSSDVAKIALKSITNPTDINQARRTLAMGYESIADTIKEGLPENIEKLTKSVLTIEKESLRNPSLLSKANLGKLSKLKDGIKGLKEKVADQVVDSIAGIGDKVVLKLSNSDLNRFSQEGSRSQQEKISNAIERLRDNTGSLIDAADIQTLSRIEAKTEALKKKNDWFKEEPLQPQQSPVLDQYGRPLNRP